MRDLTTTCRARLASPAQDEALLAFGDRFCGLTRSLMTPLRRIEATRERAERNAALAALKTAFCRDHDISARQFNSMRMTAEGAVRAAKASAQLQVKALSRSARRQTAKVSRQRAAVTKARRDLASGKCATRDPLAKALLALHGGRRRLGALIDRLRLARGEAASGGAVCFARAVLRRRPRLQVGASEAERRDHAAAMTAWRRDWRLARSGTFMLVGSADEPDGNQSCKVDFSDWDRGVIHVALRPLKAGALARVAGGAARPDGPIVLRDVPVNAHMRRVLDPVRVRMAARGGKRTGYGEKITVRFVATPQPEGRSVFEVMITVREATALRPDCGDRILGVDLNAHFVAWAVTGADGNPLSAFGRSPMSLRHKSAGQRLNIVRAAARAVVAAAVRHGCGVVAIESLDFSAQATTRFPDQNRTARAMPTRQFAEEVTRAAARAGIEVSEVNPAMTSVIGRVNWSRPMGRTVHDGAAIVIARRSAGCSERPRIRHHLRGKVAPGAPEDAPGHVSPGWQEVNDAMGSFADSSRNAGRGWRAPASAEDWAEIASSLLRSRPAPVRQRPASASGRRAIDPRPAASARTGNGRARVDPTPS